MTSLSTTSHLIILSKDLLTSLSLAVFAVQVNGLNSVLIGKKNIYDHAYTLHANGYISRETLLLQIPIYLKKQ